MVCWGRGRRVYSWNVNGDDGVSPFNIDGEDGINSHIFYECWSPKIILMRYWYYLSNLTRSFSLNRWVSFCCVDCVFTVYFWEPSSRMRQGVGRKNDCPLSHFSCMKSVISILFNGDDWVLMFESILSGN